jgi:hypothetical protein
MRRGDQTAKETTALFFHDENVANIVQKGASCMETKSEELLSDQTAIKSKEGVEKLASTVAENCQKKMK